MKVCISVLLILLAVSSYSNARRMVSDSSRFTTNLNELMFLNSCSKGQRWVNGGYNKLGKYTSGQCKSNADNCQKFDIATGNCTECKWGYDKKKNQSTGHYCDLKWWVQIGIIIAVCLVVFGFVMCLVMCCCKGKKSKRYGRDSSSSSSSGSSGIREPIKAQERRNYEIVNNSTNIMHTGQEFKQTNKNSSTRKRCGKKMMSSQKSYPGILCENCNADKNKDNCVVCDKWMPSHEQGELAYICEQCGWDRGKEQCCKCSKLIMSSQKSYPAKLCRDCGWAIKKEDCAKMK